MAALIIVFAALFTALASLAAGKLLFRALHLKLHRGEESALAFVCGSGCLSLVLFVLCVLRVAYTWVLTALGVALIAAALRLLPDRGDRLPKLPLLYRAIVLVGFVVFSALYLAHAIAPEISPDGAGYHLKFVRIYHAAHGFERITDNMYGQLSQAIDILFLMAYSFGGFSAAATFHAAYLYVLPLLMISYGRRWGYAQAGAAAALFVFLSPVVGIDGTSAYNDVALATVLFALFYLLRIWRDQSQPQLLVAVGLLAGFAFAIKYTGFIAVPYAIAAVLWYGRRLKPAFIIAGCAAVMIVPWPVKNWVWTGNPAAPFFNAQFPNPYVHVHFEQDYKFHMATYGITDRRQIPLEVTMRGALTSGVVGPLFLLSPLALLALRHREGRRLLIAAAVFLVVYPSNIGTRFLIPPLPFIAFALAIGLQWTRLLPVLVVAHAVLSWPPMIRKYAPHAWHIEKDYRRAALRIESEDDYLSRRAQEYKLVRFIDQATPPESVIFTFSQFAEAYTSRRVRVSFLSASNTLIRDALLMPLIEDWPPGYHHYFRFPSRQLRRISIEQTANGGDMWSIDQVRVFRGSHEIWPNSDWRVTARPNPWDAGLVLDDNPITRWRAWQIQEPGMHFDLDFGSALELDTVRVEAARDQSQVRLRLSGVDAQGKAANLDDRADVVEVPNPKGLRRLATQEAKRRGVDYLLLFAWDFGFEDFTIKADEWGLELVGQVHPGSLYRLK